MINVLIANFGICKPLAELVLDEFNEHNIKEVNSVEAFLFKRNIEKHYYINDLISGKMVECLING